MEGRRRACVPFHKIVLVECAKVGQRYLFEVDPKNFIFCVFEVHVEHGLLQFVRIHYTVELGYTKFEKEFSLSTI